MTDYSVSVALGGGITGFSGVYNVLDYGAVMDGSTDDSAAIQAALTAAASVGGILYFPSGTYLLRSTLVVPDGTGDLVIRGDNATLDGDDSLDIGLEFEGGNPSSATYGRIRISGMTFTGFTLWGISSTTSVSEVYSSIERFSCNECEFTACGGGIKLLATVSAARISDNSFTSLSRSDETATAAIRVGIDEYDEQDDGTNCIITDNYIDGVTHATSSKDCQGILVYGSYAKITDNTVRDVKNTGDGNNAEGIYTKCRHSVIANNTLVDGGSSSNGCICIKGTDRGESMSGSNPEGYGVEVRGNKIISIIEQTYNADNVGIFISAGEVAAVGNYIEGARKYGIEVKNIDMDNIEIRDNRIVNTRGTLGIYTTSTGNGLRIDGNTIRGLGVGSSDTSASAYGIYLNPQVSTNDLNNVSVSNNIIIDNDETVADTSIRGILMRTNGGDINRVRVVGNYMDFLEPTLNEVGIDIQGDTDSITGLYLANNYTNGIDDTKILLDTSVSFAGESAVTAAADDTTPSVLGASTLLLGDNTGATAITQLDFAYPGQEVSLVVTGSSNTPTISDGGNFTLAGNWTPGTGDTLRVVTSDGSAWYELSRSNN